MLIFLTLLLALSGGAFAPTVDDGSSGPPDLGMVMLPVASSPAPVTVTAPVPPKGGVPGRYDGSSGPPDHH